METFKSIKSRRSVRSFTKRKVSASKIQKIIDAGLYAPSSKNCRPWDFFILSGKKKDKVAEIAEKNFEQPSWYPPSKSSVLASCRVIREAPILILVLNKGPRSGGEKKARKDAKLISAIIAETLSLGACIENMLLEATSLGLGSLWIGDLRNAKPQVEKHLKTKYDIIAGISIGYPTYQPRQKTIPKFDISKAIASQKHNLYIGLH
jgi:nitroreductase